MLQMSSVACPYCGESIALQVDVSAGDHDCIEDCPVCCRPIEVSVRAQSQQGARVRVRSGDA